METKFESIAGLHTMKALLLVDRGSAGRNARRNKCLGSCQAKITKCANVLGIQSIIAEATKNSYVNFFFP